jgi:hypothetical protein
MLSRVRTARHLGLSLIATAVPTAALVWHDLGTAIGLFVAGTQLYVGLFAAFALPRLVRRAAQEAECGPSSTNGSHRT